MPMTRSGLSSLMGYAPGGIVGLETDYKRDTGGLDSIVDANAVANANTEIPTNQTDVSSTPTSSDALQSNISALLLQAVNPMSMDVSQRSKEYQNMLRGAVSEPRRPSFYDLASEIGRGLLAQQSEKLPSIGRGVGLGFQSFKQEHDAKTKAFDEKLDNLAVQSVSLAIGDKQKAEQNYNELVYKELLDSINPDKGTAVTYGKKLENGEMSYKTFGSKEVSDIAEATADGYAEIKSPMVQIGGDSDKGLAKLYEELGRAAGKQEGVYTQDYELANKSNQLLDQMEKYGYELPEDAFGLAPQLFEPIRRFIVSFPGIKNLPIADGLKEIQSKSEPMASVTVNLAMMNVQKTKGPISDTEMRLFISSIPSLAQTKDGYFATIGIMREINDFVIKFETERQNQRDSYMSREGASISGLQSHMTKWETQWRKDNRAFTDEQLETFRDKALETEANPERQRIANEAINYFDTMSKSSKEAESVATEDTDYLEELEEILLNIKK